MYVRVYTDGSYEFHETVTLEAAERPGHAEGDTTTRTLDGPWAETPRPNPLTTVSSVSLRNDERGWPLTNAELRAAMADDDPHADCAAVEISVSGSMAVHVSAPDDCRPAVTSDGRASVVGSRCDGSCRSVGPLY